MIWTPSFIAILSKGEREGFLLFFWSFSDSAFHQHDGGAQIAIEKSSRSIFVRVERLLLDWNALAIPIRLPEQGLMGEQLRISQSELNISFDWLWSTYHEVVKFIEPRAQHAWGNKAASIENARGLIEFNGPVKSISTIPPFFHLYYTGRIMHVFSIVKNIYTHEELRIPWILLEYHIFIMFILNPWYFLYPLSFSLLLAPILSSNYGSNFIHWHFFIP